MASTEENPAVTARDPNIEQDVRAMVKRIVDGLLDASGEAASHDEDVAAAPSATVTVAVGADHGGFALKEKLGFRLREAGYEVIDCGTDSSEAVDYPDFAVAVARSVATGAADAGVMVDGAGIGSAMAANKVPGVRAAMCYDVSTARNAREHNHANVLTLGAGLIGDALAWQITQEFMNTEFGPGRHARRVEKIDALDSQPAGAV